MNKAAAVFLDVKGALIVYHTGESKPFAQIILFCSYNNSAGVSYSYLQRNEGPRKLSILPQITQPTNDRL